MGFKGTVLDRREKPKKAAGLNLVSLMDIFTILVFFLLMNSGDSQEIEKANFITLPDSQAKGSFQNELLISIGDEYITIGDQKIVDVKTVEQAKGKPIAALSEVLKQAAIEKGELTDFEKKNGRSVTIMGDKDVPYLILKGVMATCSQENFRDIALAVNQVVGSALVSGGQP